MSWNSWLRKLANVVLFRRNPRAKRMMPAKWTARKLMVVEELESRLVPSATAHNDLYTIAEDSGTFNAPSVLTNDSTTATPATLTAVYTIGSGPAHGAFAF